MKTFAAFISLCLCLSGNGQEERKEEKEAAAVPEFHVTEIDKIRAAKGTKVKVYGKVTRTNKSKNTGTNFLNFEIKDFTVVTFGRDLKAFTKGEPADTFKDKFIEITGVIEFYKDAPQIVLSSVDQIREVPEKKPPSDEAEAKPAGKDKPEPEAPAKDLPQTVDPKKYFTD